jgi:hypothetical protein
MKFLGGAGLLLTTVICACGPAPTAPPATWRLSVAAAGDGSGLIRAGGLIFCGGAFSSNACSANVPRGVVMTLEAEAEPGSTFEGWVTGCSGTGPCTPPPDADIQVNALFRAKFSPITVTFEGDGGGRVISEPAGIDCGSDCTASFREGARVTFRATASPGSSFAGWRGGCAVDYGDFSRCDVLPESATGPLRAAFSRLPPPPPPVFRVVKPGTGSGLVRSNPPGIDCGNVCSDVWDAGTVIELTAAASPGSIFEQWTDGGTDPTRLVTMGEVDTLVGATFSITNHLLTVVALGGGSGTLTLNGTACGSSCTQLVSYGSLVRLTAVANANSWFVGWSEPGWSSFCGWQRTCDVTVTEARTVTATFAPVVPFGNATAFAQSVNVAANLITAERVVISRAGTVHALGLIAMGGNTWARMGLYGDSGALLGETGLLPFGSGGYAYPLASGPLSLPVGTYWIAANFDTSAVIGAQLSSTATVATRSSPARSPLPNPLGATSTVSGPSHNFYVLLE